MGHETSWKVMGMVVLVALLFAGQSSAQVALYVVDQTTDDVEADGCVNLVGLVDCSLRGAIHRANTDGVDSRVVVPAGTYVLSLTDDSHAGGDLDVYENGTRFELQAQEVGGPVVIVQSLADRVLDIGAGPSSVLVQGPMTLRSTGTTSFGEYGGVLSIRSAIVDLELLTLEDGDATGNGGCLSMTDALIGSSADWSLENVTLRNCTASADGGGASILLGAASPLRGGESRGGGSLSMVGLEVTGNQAGELGGGLFLSLRDPAIATLAEAIVRNNAAGTGPSTTGAGGGIRRAGGTSMSAGGGILFIERSEISENQAGTTNSPNGFGGGIATSGFGTTQIENTTISHNRVRGGFNGGVGLHARSEVNLSHVTIVEPEGSEFSLETALTHATDSVVTVERSIVVGGCWGTEPLTIGQFNYEALPSDAPTDGSALSACGFDATATGQLVADAGLLPLAPNGSLRRTHAPTASSPVLDGAFSGGCPALDQRGAGRAAHVCEPGAHERDPQFPPPDPFLFADGFESGNTSAWQ